MPGYRRHFSSSRYKSQSHSRTKRGWFCLVPSKLDSRSVQCSTTAGLCVVPGNQPQTSNVIAGFSRRGTRPGSVWIQCASASCPHNARQRCWRLSAALCWRQRTATLNTNDVLQYRKRVNALTTTMFAAQPIVVTPWHPDTAQRHNARDGRWAHKAKPRRCQHKATPTTRSARSDVNAKTTVHKTRCAPYTVQLRARITDTALSQPPTLNRHQARSHSRTKRAWFCLVPSKRDPRSARCSTTVGHCVACDDQSQPSSVIPGNTQRWARPVSVAAQYASAVCPYTACLHWWTPGAGLCWRPRRPASNTGHAQQCPKGESASPTTLCGAQSTIVAPRLPSAAPRYGTRGWQWAHKSKLHRCQSEATLIVHSESQCPKEESASITTLCGAQSIIVAPRQPSASHRHNARSGQWAHKAKPRRCQYKATLIVHPESQCPKWESTSITTLCGAELLIVAPRQPSAAPRHNARSGQWAHKGKLHCRAHHCLKPRIAAHKTGLAPHTFQLRARGTDTVLPQPPALGRQRAQSHSRTKKVSCARCNPGRFPGQTALDYPCPDLATTTVSHRQSQQTNVAQRQRTTPETRGTTLAQRGILTLGSSVRAWHSLAITRLWPGTTWFNAAVTRRRPRPPTVRPMILTIVGAPFQRSTNQATYSVGPGQQPWSPPRQIADVPPRHGTVLCPASRTGNRYTAPVTRCVPETLTKAPHRDACRVAPAVCALPRARHAARMTLDRRRKPVTAQSTIARLAQFHTGEVAQ